MIPSSYSFVFVHRSHGFDGVLRIDLYRFTSVKSGLDYLVRVEEYPNNMYAVKFYLKNHSHSDKKYQLLTNTFEARTIINTCINIMLSVYEKNDNASFGFIGSNSDGEPVANTKRYRVYSKIIATYFSDKLFMHIENIDKSVYMLINRKQLELNPNLIDDIEESFMQMYDYFD